MIISLKNFIPLPLYGHKGNSGIWESEEIIFESPRKSLLLASSGRGKTSVLSMIYGVRKDYRGSIDIDSCNSRNFSLKDWSELRKKRLAFVFQGLELFDELSAWDNIQLKNRILHYKSDQEITALAESLEMEGYLKQACGTLSFGQRQRIAIIRALCQPFEFFLGDEIFSHLDKKLEKQCLGIITEECRQNNAGLILTSLHKLEDYAFDTLLSL
ncbi:MAG: ATP-binding cassette domain-containing protein [Bacteroidales bacterium]|nr:ATP-binding cassette domain-containing protein [Bacteroidales bacterium]